VVWAKLKLPTAGYSGHSGEAILTDPSDASFVRNVRDAMKFQSDELTSANDCPTETIRQRGMNLVLIAKVVFSIKHVLDLCFSMGS